MHYQDHGRERGRPAGHEMASGPHASHDRHAGHSVAMFRDKFWLSFALTIPVVVWSPDDPWFRRILNVAHRLAR